MNKMGVVVKVVAQTGLSHAMAAAAVDATFAAIGAALKSNDEVRLTGFGSFAVVTRKASVGRNPRTGEELQIGPSTSVRFKPGKSLKDAVG